MNENDFQSIYNALIQVLRRDTIGLGRIANRVEEIVEEGKIIKEKVQVELDETPIPTDLMRNRVTKKSTRSLYRRVEYTEKEKLTLLLDAIEATVVNPAVIRREVTEIFADQAAKTTVESQDVFLYPNLAQDENPIVLTSEAATADVEKLSDLIGWINTLREEIRRADSR